jgi:hypothetical protein
MKYYHLLLLLAFFSCGDDKKDAQVSNEEAYFEDYDSPRDKWGYIDTTGVLVIDKKYDDLRPFKNGLAMANYEGKWGFIDKKGFEVIPFKYRSTFPFKDGLARIQNFDKKYGFIDKSGATVIPDTMGLVYDFNSERARAKKGDIYGYVNTKGKWVIEPQFKKCSNFVNGHARVYQFGKAALIGTDGKFKIPYEDGNDKLFSTESNVIRAKKGKMYRYYSLKNYKIVKDNVLNGIDFVDNLAALEKEEGEWDIVDINFRKKFSVDADKVKYGGNGNWIIVKDKKYKLFNSKGKEQTTNDYDMIFAFNEGIAPFEKNEKWGYMNEMGEELMPAVLPLAWEFKEGYARVLSNGIVYMNKNMEYLVRKGFKDAHNFSEGFAHVQ